MHVEFIPRELLFIVYDENCEHGVKIKMFMDDSYISGVYYEEFDPHGHSGIGFPCPTWNIYEPIPDEEDE